MGGDRRPGDWVIPPLPHAADLGHTFRLVVTSRMSSMVVGDEHHSDAPEFGSTELVLKVRAWDLPSALRAAAERPLSDWTHAVEPRAGRWHVHWFRPVSDVYGPFWGNRYGSMGRRDYECRCGEVRTRDAVRR